MWRFFPGRIDLTESMKAIKSGDGEKFLDDGVGKKLGPTPGIDLKGHISRWMKTSGWARREKKKRRQYIPTETFYLAFSLYSL